LYTHKQCRAIVFMFIRYKKSPLENEFVNIYVTGLSFYAFCSVTNSVRLDLEACQSRNKMDGNYRRLYIVMSLSYFM